MPVRVLASVLAAVLTLAACGGGDDDKKPSKSSTPTKTVAEHVISSTAAKSALLTTKDVGSPLKKTPYHRPTTPLFCNGANAPTVYKESNASNLVGARFTSKDPKADIIEEIYVFKTAAGARAALSQVQSDMDCAAGHTYNSDGTSDVISIGASTDYSSKLTADFAFGWSLRTGDSRGIEIAIPVKTTLLLFRYTAGNFADTDKLPDAFDLASIAFDRLRKK